MELQHLLSNGNWVDSGSRSEEFIQQAIAFIENHPNKKNLLGEFSTVIKKLESGNSVYMGTDWYDQIRYKPEPREQKNPVMIKCSCGHYVSEGSVMSASLGTSCPDCYDRMSG